MALASRGIVGAMQRKFPWILAVVSILFWGWLFSLVQVGGVFRHASQKELGACKTVRGLVGVEDLTIDKETRFAYLSGLDRRAVLAGRDVRGAIWLYDLNESNPVPIDLTAGLLTAGFQPHGLSLFVAADGERTLFVINHANKQHSVEIFTVRGRELLHRRTVTGDGLISPNDLVGVSKDAFFVTNDHAYTSGLMSTLEEYLQFRLTRVSFFDGFKFKTAISGLGGSNGINVSADGKFVYVSAMNEETVYVYERDTSTNVLTRKAGIKVAGWPDNIEVMQNGDLLVGVHSRIFDLLAHRDDAKNRSPSHIVWLKQDGDSFTPQTIYYTHGEQISGASVAAGLGERLLIGSIFEEKILDCSWQK